MKKTLSLALSLIMIITIPSISSVSKKTKEKMLANKIELAEKALLLWGQDNKKCFIALGTDCLEMTSCASTSANEICKTTTLGKMASFGLIEYDDKTNLKVLSPVDNSDISSYPISIIYNTNNKSLEINN